MFALFHQISLSFRSRQPHFRFPVNVDTSLTRAAVAASAAGTQLRRLRQRDSVCVCVCVTLCAVLDTASGRVAVEFICCNSHVFNQLDHTREL